MIRLWKRRMKPRAGTALRLFRPTLLVPRLPDDQPDRRARLPCDRHAVAQVPAGEDAVRIARQIPPAENETSSTMDRSASSMGGGKLPIPPISDLSRFRFTHFQSVPAHGDCDSVAG